MGSYLMNLRTRVLLMILGVSVFAGLFTCPAAFGIDGYVDHIAVTYYRNGVKIYNQTVAHGETVIFDEGTTFSILIYRGGGTSRWTMYIVGPGGYSDEGDTSGSYRYFGEFSDEGKWWGKVDNSCQMPGHR